MSAPQQIEQLRDTAKKVREVAELCVSRGFPGSARRLREVADICDAEAQALQAKCDEDAGSEVAP